MSMWATDIVRLKNVFPTIFLLLIIQAKIIGTGIKIASVISVYARLFFTALKNVGFNRFL